MPSREERGRHDRSHVRIDENGFLPKAKVGVRQHGEPTVADSDEVDYVDVSSKQIVSVATACIPFLEHDDANRALMGTNMQRQAVPCIKPEAPIVGTGVERRAAVDSGHVAISDRDGEVTAVQGDQIEVTDRGRPGPGLGTEQVPALQPFHLPQPAPDGRSRDRRSGRGR